MRQIRSRLRAAVALSLAFVAHAGATARYDYKPGEFLVIDSGTSPDKKFSIVSDENKPGEFGVYLRDAQTKELIGQLEEVATGLDSAPDASAALYQVSFDAEGECELLPNDNSRVLNTQSVKE